jgi:hypothetical protein
MRRLIELVTAMLVTASLSGVAHAQKCMLTESSMAMTCPTVAAALLCPTEFAMVEVVKAVRLGPDFILPAVVKYGCSALPKGTELVIGNIDHDDDNRFSAIQVGIPNGNMAWVSPFSLGSDWVRDNE